jgi:hypothetical protein
LRGQLADEVITEHGRCLAQQIAELLDRDRLEVVLFEVGLDELRERQSSRDPAFSSKPLELAFERSRASCSEANPPRWTRLEPRPPVR